jgi:plasmid stabilization system protein ParE
MNVKYVLSPQAADDLFEIWDYIEQRSTREIADRVEANFLQKFEFLAKAPGTGFTSKFLQGESSGDPQFIPI